MGQLVLFSALIVLMYMSIWFFIALIKKRNDVADIAWGLGFVTLAWSIFIYKDFSLDTKTILVLIMVTLWGFRLATHIALRHKNKPEDGRYIAMKNGWKYKNLQAYTNVFLTQGFFMLLVAMPIILYFINDNSEVSILSVIGLTIWAIGFLFESIGDYQLKKFIENPKNKAKIMKYGLWKYTRHPNYFGEISLWWGFYIFTLFTPYWYIGIIGPLTITILIIGVSGIPMLEKRYIGNKEYEEYQKTTNAFFPSFQK